MRTHVGKNHNLTESEVTAMYPARGDVSAKRSLQESNIISSPKRLRLAKQPQSPHEVLVNDAAREVLYDDDGDEYVVVYEDHINNSKQQDENNEEV